MKNVNKQLNNLNILVSKCKQTCALIWFWPVYNSAQGVSSIFYSLSKVKIYIQITETQLSANNFSISFRKSGVAHWHPLHGSLIENFHKSLICSLSTKCTILIGFTQSEKKCKQKWNTKYFWFFWKWQKSYSKKSIHFCLDILKVIKIIFFTNFIMLKAILHQNDFSPSPQQFTWHQNLPLR